MAVTRPWCVLWDAACPFASVGLARRVLAAAQPTGAATACTPAEVPWLVLHRDRVAGAHAARDSARPQTPRAYATALLRACAQRAEREGRVVQSGVELFLHAGHEVRAVDGEKLNVKLTMPEDLVLAEALLSGLPS